MTRAARAIVEESRSVLTDARATTALTVGAAMLIVKQEELMKDVFWFTEGKRAPSAVK